MALKTACETTRARGLDLNDSNVVVAFENVSVRGEAHFTHSFIALPNMST
jgi:hypothetical protein